MKRMRVMVCGAWVIVAAAGLAMPALGDDAKDALGGPAVQDRNVPGVAGSFGEGVEGKKRTQAMRLPPQVFRESMNAVMGDDAPADVRVTAEQREKFEGWFDEFQDSVREYQRTHRQEIQELRRKTGDQRGRRPGGGGGGPQRGAPSQDDQMNAAPDDKEVAAARDQLRQIMEGAPKIEDIHTKVWAELNEKQKAAVDEKIAVFRERQAQDREENYVRQKTGKKAEGAEQARQMEQERAAPDGQRPPRRPAADGATPGRRPGGPGGPGGPGAGGPEGQRGPSNVSPERRDRVMRLLNRLTPEQQDQVIARLEERLRDAGLDGPQGGRRPDGRRGGPKPPPAMDDVNVPPPPPPESMNDGKQP